MTRSTAGRRVRDLTAAQFERALASEGMSRAGCWGGYVNVVAGLHVHPLNAGDNRRAQLAYLIRERDKYLAQQEESADA